MYSLLEGCWLSYTLSSDLGSSLTSTQLAKLISQNCNRSKRCVEWFLKQSDHLLTKHNIEHWEETRALKWNPCRPRYNLQSTFYLSMKQGKNELRKVFPLMLSFFEGEILLVLLAQLYQRPYHAHLLLSPLPTHKPNVFLFFEYNFLPVILSLRPVVQQMSPSSPPWPQDFGWFDSCCMYSNTTRLQGILNSLLSFRVYVLWKWFKSDNCHCCKLFISLRLKLKTLSLSSYLWIHTK